MPSTALAAAIAEAQTHQTQIAPELAGFQNFARIDLREDTRADIQTAIADYERRKALVEAYLKAADALADDGYPELPIRKVLASRYEELKQNQAESAAALAKFAPIHDAVAGEITFGTSTPT
jgi:hypothetical protein